ncbi:unnamed protein product [Cochlearia groenlandica]
MVAYIEARGMAFTQLAALSILNMVVTIVTTTKLGFEMTLKVNNEISKVSQNNASIRRLRVGPISRDSGQGCSRTEADRGRYSYLELSRRAREVDDSLLANAIVGATESPVCRGAVRALESVEGGISGTPQAKRWSLLAEGHSDEAYDSESQVLARQQEELPRDEPPVVDAAEDVVCDDPPIVDAPEVSRAELDEQFAFQFDEVNLHGFTFCYDGPELFTSSIESIT